MYYCATIHNGRLDLCVLMHFVHTIADDTSKTLAQIQGSGPALAKSKKVLGTAFDAELADKLAPGHRHLRQLGSP